MTPPSLWTRPARRNLLESVRRPFFSSLPVVMIAAGGFLKTLSAAWPPWASRPMATGLTTSPRSISRCPFFSQSPLLTTFRSSAALSTTMLSALSLTRSLAANLDRRGKRPPVGTKTASPSLRGKGVSPWGSRDPSARNSVPGPPHRITVKGRYIEGRHMAAAERERAATRPRASRRGMVSSGALADLPVDDVQNVGKDHAGAAMPYF